VVAASTSVDPTFRRIDAAHFSMATMTDSCRKDLNAADHYHPGVSRTFKGKPTSLSGQRGYKTANLPLVP